MPPLERSPSAQPCGSVSWEQNGYYTELSDARYSSSGVERIQLPSRCYPCGRRGGHIEHLWTSL